METLLQVIVFELSAVHHRGPPGPLISNQQLYNDYGVGWIWKIGHPISVRHKDSSRV
jgi:hypothetical protein